MEYDWRYLCSDPRRLGLTLMLLPRAMPGLIAMQICYASHLDPPDHAINLANVANMFAPAWLNWETYDLSQLKGMLPAPLAAYWQTGKPRWSLAMKLLMPYVQDGPYLYTDDDVIISGDPSPLMINSFGSKGCFRFSANKHSVPQQLFEAFELESEVFHGPDGDVRYDTARSQYNNAALDAGVWFQLYPDDWSQMLHRFADLRYISDLTIRNLELRCLDQRFLTVFGIKHGWTPITIGNGFAPPRALSERTLTRHPFFHYKSSSKQAWMNVLEAYLGILRAK